MEALKSELVARECCSLIKINRNQMNSEYTDYREDQRHRQSTESLLTSEYHSLKCAFCRDIHYSDKCSVVTDLVARNNIIWERRLCYKCVISNDTKRNCRKRGKCYNCKSANHHTAICTKRYPRGNRRELSGEKNAFYLFIKFENSRVLANHLR